jgi:hypothetical protein
MMEHHKLFMIGVAFFAIGFQISVRAASIETLVMPGPVSEAHAGIEEECSECHAAFSQTLQRDLCLSCHEHRSVMEDLAAGTGFHGRFESARNVECATCHADHEGREADIVRLDTETFDHDFTDFVLEGSHADVACEDCHSAGGLFREAQSACFDCHQEDDDHQGRLGEDCGSCHQSTSWRTTTFDHAQETDFTLTGAHQTVECALCHTNQQYEGIPDGCYSCHQLDDNHKGEYGRDCKQCHQTEDWKQTTFDHAETSGFALHGRHSEIDCTSCHQGSLFDAPLAPECTSCHLADDVHQGSNGTDCGACHDSRQWSNTSFDHQADTDFPLIGAHTDLDCRVCHTGGALDLAFDIVCFSCHRVDDVHQDGLGENCARCHQPTGWTVDVLFDHDLNRFPLIGLHAVALCEACHLSPRFTDTPALCIDCHEKEDSHDGGLGTDCGACHNPNDWLLWDFDHNASTSFILDGAHADLACRDCHQQGQNYQARPPTVCASCHLGDDVHSRQFGRQCARCHDTRSFNEIRALQ